MAVGRRLPRGQEEYCIPMLRENTAVVKEKREETQMVCQRKKTKWRGFRSFMMRRARQVRGDLVAETALQRGTFGGGTKENLQEKKSNATGHKTTMVIALGP